MRQGKDFTGSRLFFLVSGFHRNNIISSDGFSNGLLTIDRMQNKDGELESNPGELKSKNQRKKERNKLKKRTLKQMETKQIKSTLM